MNRKPYLLFDAGGTLVFPNYGLTAQIAREGGIEVSEQELAITHAQVFRDFDQSVAQEHRFPKIHYFPELFSRLTPDEKKVRAATELALQYDRQRSLWTSTFSWVSDSLTHLAKLGYRMSVISNSDGRVETILDELGLREHFEIVIDSYLVGLEKPDRRIFELALHELNLEPEQAIYIGDIFYVDVWGANQAGVGAIHLDQQGLYQGWVGAHISSVDELSQWLAQFDGNLPRELLYPVQDFEII
jgi:putative hydrolase of the HAD superfamily